MNRCLKIAVTAAVSAQFLHSFIQTNAKKCGVEGTVQALDDQRAQIIACGSEEGIDTLMDLLHQGMANGVVMEISAEPFIKGKDYRGVFRIIE